MADLLIRNLDDKALAALAQSAAADGVSKAEKARELLHAALTPSPKKRRDLSILRGVFSGDMTPEQRAAFEAIDCCAPSYTDQELDQFMKNEEARNSPTHSGHCRT